MAYAHVLKVLLLETPTRPRKPAAVVKARLPAGFTALLKEKLKCVAMGQPKYSQLTKRSLLRLYNDILAPRFSVYTLEELVLRYMTLMKKEQQLLGEDTLPLEDFLDLLKPLLRQCPGSEDCLAKLGTLYEKEHTHKVSEIKDSQLLMQLYLLDTDQLQIQVNNIKVQLGDWFADLIHIKESMLKNEYSITPDSFDSPELYFQWRRNEVNELDQLIKGRPLKGGVIPPEPKAVLEELIRHAFINYTLSNAMRLIDKCCKYWRISHSTKCVLIHKVGNETVLNTETYNTELSASLFTASSPVDPIWLNDDRRQNNINWELSSTRLHSAIRSTVQDIYTFPKFTPLLQLYYTYIKTSQQKWIKRLKNALYSTTEKKYIEFLQLVPRDNTLSHEHIELVSHRIYETLRSLQKKYPKPLLDEINIPLECGFMLIKFFGEDATNMLKHIEHYTIDSPTDCVQALDTYVELKNLRDVHSQISKEPFPVNLEKQFFRYLDEFTDQIGEKFIPMTERAIATDIFLPMDAENGRLYSSSALDMHKIIHEMWSLVKKYHWTNDIQLAYVYTKLLKHVSEAIGLYCSTLVAKVDNNLREVDEQVDKRKPTWFKNDGPAPTPFNFKLETCVMLNDLSQLLHQLVELEQSVNPDSLQRILRDTVENIEQKAGNNVFTIRVIQADNIQGTESADTYISIIDTQNRQEVGKTSLVSKSLNPRFDQLFELETSHETTLSLSLWDKSSHQHKLIGRTLVKLDPCKFSPNGEPVPITKDFDIQGALQLEISLESEKNDAIFYMGKSYRTISRSVDMVISKIVNKFSVFISHCLSKQTLKQCSPTEVDSVNDAIAPLFEYLNANLQTLATTLTQELLLKVMIRAWNVVLANLDNLVLPSLAAAKSLLPSSKWTLNVMNKGLPGYGKVLTVQEVQFIRLWMESLSEFFHNEGEGPPIAELHTAQYQNLSQIVAYYDMNYVRLERLVEEWTPLSIAAIKQRNFMLDDNVKRSGTIVAHATKKRRQETHVRHENTHLELEDIVLRVLLCKEQRDFVQKRLTERERVMRSVATERLAELAMRRS